MPVLLSVLSVIPSTVPSEADALFAPSVLFCPKAFTFPPFHTPLFFKKPLIAPLARYRIRGFSTKCLMDFRNIFLTFAPETMLTTPVLKNNIPCPDACQRPQKTFLQEYGYQLFCHFLSFRLGNSFLMYYLCTRFLAAIRAFAKMMPGNRHIGKA